ncbi:MAG: FumA C-terminus/TtdB family hydratase beta subunit [Oscillospiraceae bacterium]|nr:FumA C-terminus/TtdB family hydratase beta subunit [Oscillospiraceae bacterium]
MHTSELREAAKTLSAGENILLSGEVFTARDAAHKRLMEMKSAASPLPITIDGGVVYYAGPTPAPEGMVIGSCGPTTSGRMDPYTPKLLDDGLCAMIGKGERSEGVIEAIRRNKAVYLCALGGLGALAAKCITSCEVVAFEDLGCESIKKLTLREFPLVVGIDCNGGNIFDKG